MRKQHNMALVAMAAVRPWRESASAQSINAAGATFPDAIYDEVV